MQEQKEIDWSDFSGDYVKFEEKVPMALVLTDWKQDKSIINNKELDVLCFNVLKMDGKEVEKKLNVSSKRLAMALKPFIEAATAEKQEAFECLITKSGTGFDTEYDVTSVAK